MSLRKTFLSKQLFREKILKISLFIIMVGAYLEDLYEIQKEPIYELKESETRVYIGRDLKTNQEVLIKTRVVNQSLVKHTTTIEECISRIFINDVALKSIGQFHVFYDKNTRRRIIYFIYDYSGHCVLQDYIVNKSKNNTFMIDEAIEIIRNILIGIQHLNERKIYLVNLNTENIVINEQNEIKFIDLSFLGFVNFLLITDFNSIDISLFKDKVAPEISDTVKDKKKCDVYSFGLIMQNIYGFINFGGYEDIKNKYEDLMENCLKKEVYRRLDVENALDHPLFQLTLPDLYEIDKLEDFEIKENEYSIFLFENFLTFEIRDLTIMIKQAKHASVKDNILHILQKEDFDFFYINSISYLFSSISYKNMEYIAFMFEVIKYRALQSNFQIEARQDALGIDCDQQKKYLQSLRVKRKPKLNINLPQPSQVVLNSNTSAKTGNNTPIFSGPKAESKTPLSNSQQNTENDGISIQKPLTISAIIAFIGGSIFFIIYRYCKMINNNELN